MAQRNVGLMGQYAGFVTRMVAIIIDILIVIVSVLVITASISLPINFFLGVNIQSCTVAGAGSSLLHDWVWLRDLLCGAFNVISVTVAILTGPIYFIFLATAGGQTVGKYVMGVRVVRLDGKPMTYVGSALRWFGYLASLLPLGMGFFWVVIDDRRRGFHDKIAGTCVLYSWRAQQDEYLLARIHRFFGRVSKKGRVALMRSLATQEIELVTFAVPGFNELNDVLRIVKDGVQDGEFELLGFQEYAKSTDGQLNHLEVDPMLEGVGSVVEFSAYGGLTPARIHQIRDELPNDHFALAVLISEQDADRLVKLVARRTAAQIRRYDLRETRARTMDEAESSTSHTETVTGAPVLPPPAQITAAPAAPSAWPANGAPLEDHPAPSPDLLAAVDNLQRQQAALQAELAARDEALHRLEVQVQITDAQLADALASRYSALASPITAPPVAAPQPLTPIRGIGPVFEQRLYAGGIQSYAALAAATPEQLAQIVNAPKPAQPDYAGWIAEARQLAGLSA